LCFVWRYVAYGEKALAGVYQRKWKSEVVSAFWSLVVRESEVFSWSQAGNLSK